MGTFNSTPLPTLPTVYNRLFDLIKKYQFNLDINKEDKWGQTTFSDPF